MLLRGTGGGGVRGHSKHSSRLASRRHLTWTVFVLMNFEGLDGQAHKVALRDTNTLFAIHPLTVRWCCVIHTGPLRGPVQSIARLDPTVFMIIPHSYCYSYCTLWLSVSAAAVWPPPTEEQTVALCEKFAVNCDFHSFFLCVCRVGREEKSPNAIIRLPLRAAPLIFGVRPVIRRPLGAPASRRHLGSDPLPSSDSIKKKKLNFSSCSPDQTGPLMHFLCDVFFHPVLPPVYHLFTYRLSIYQPAF